MNKEVKQWLKATLIVIGIGIAFIVGVMVASLLSSYSPYLLGGMLLITILVILVCGVKEYLDDTDECKIDLDLDEDDINQIR